jgi:hypothetical protein
MKAVVGAPVLAECEFASQAVPVLMLLLLPSTLHTSA